MDTNDELVDIVIGKIKAGENRKKIVDSLKARGWEEVDVDRAMSHIKKAAFRRMPIISPILKFIDELEAKNSELSIGKLITIIAFLSISVLLLGVMLYLMFDPLNTKVKVQNTPVSVPAASDVLPETEAPPAQSSNVGNY